MPTDPVTLPLGLCENGISKLNVPALGVNKSEGGLSKSIKKEEHGSFDNMALPTAERTLKIWMPPAIQDAMSILVAEKVNYTFV